MSIIDRLFRRTDDRAALIPLYNAVVARGRAPHWYIEGGVADTVDGRFDMIAAILSIVLVRMEKDERCRLASVQLTELFVSDMDGQLRQVGIGDVTVGKHIGKMMSALGGRLSVYREALEGDGSFEDALIRNLYRGNDPAKDALAHVAGKLREFHAALGGVSEDPLLAGELPPA